MKPVKLLLKLHKRTEKTRKLVRYLNKRIQRDRKEMSTLIKNIPTEQLLQYGELMGYIK